MENTKSDLLALKEEIYSLELAVANRAIKNADDVISEGFKEIGSSGRVYCKSDYLDSLNAKGTAPDYQIYDFEITMLAENIILASYKSRLKEAFALRSSIWKKEDDNWKLTFHQGTKTGK